MYKINNHITYMDKSEKTDTQVKTEKSDKTTTTVNWDKLKWAYQNI